MATPSSSCNGWPPNGGGGVFGDEDVGGMRRGMGDGGQASVEPLGFELGVDGKGVVCARYRGPTHDAASGHYQALEGQPGP